MKTFYFLFISVIFGSCNFEFVKEEEPKTEIEKAYFVSANFIFYSRNSDNPSQINLSPDSNIPLVSTYFTTDNVPDGAFLYDNEMLFYFSISDEFFTDIVNIKTKRDGLPYFYRDSIYLPIYSALQKTEKSNLQFKFKFSHKYYSDSLLFNIPDPIKILSFNSTYSDSISYFSTELGPLILFNNTCEIFIEKHSFDKLKNENWEIAPSFYYIGNAGDVVNNVFYPYIFQNDYSLSYEGEIVKVTYKFYSRGKGIYLYYLEFTKHFSEIARAKYKVNYK